MEKLKCTLVALAMLPVFASTMPSQTTVGSFQDAELANGPNIDYKKQITQVQVPANSRFSSLDAWVDALIVKESSGNTNVVILDVNNRYSYGCLQFQMATWLGYSKKFGLGYTADEILDCDKQKYLTKLIIQNEPNTGWRNWYTSVITRGLGLPPL